MKGWILIISFLSMASGNQLLAQTSKPDRFLELRGGDSLWFVERGFAANRYYIGNQRVNTSTWLQQLETGDIEVREHMLKFQRYRRQGAWWELGGSTIVLVGCIMALSEPYGSYEIKTTPIVVMGIGLAAMGVGLIQASKGIRYFRQGLTLFNYKARKGTLQPVLLELQGAGAGISMQLKF
jgi:hypothetical protein